MRKKRLVVPVLVAALTLTSLTCGCNTSESRAETPDAAVTSGADALASDEVAIERNVASNPIGGYDADGNLMYGGDPAIMADGDTVYLYTGHDTAANEAYRIPEWMCYSTKDLKDWKYEGVIMNANSDVSWHNVADAAWAAQTIKYKDKYYFYYCTWDKTSSGKQSIGVAVSDSATGPFKDIGEPVVKGTVTEPQTSDWNDIDPTVWVETGTDGVEHRYLAWGNGIFYVCELNEDMVSVKDLNGDGKITCGTSSKEADIIEKRIANYTEAPWIYRRQDADGNYYGRYYLFYAEKWREQSAYATTDDLLDGTWEYGGVLMPPVATSNTSHMGVIDFKGKTYFLYHNGMLPGGSGFRRIANLTELKFDDDGKVLPMTETAAGLFGNTSVIYTNSGKTLSHKALVNSNSDSSDDYPIRLKAGPGLSGSADDAEWLFMDGKYDKTKASYVSIQSENKPGLYITAQNSTEAILTQDTDASRDTSAKQTFRSIKGLDDEKGVSFESVAYPGNYLSILNGTLVLSDGSDKVASTFYLGIDESDTSLRSIAATASQKQFHAGDKIDGSVQVTAAYANGETKEVKDFTTNIASVDTSKTGKLTFEVTYEEGGISKTTSVQVAIVARLAKVKNLKAKISGKKTRSVKLTWGKTAGAKGYEVYYSRQKNKGYEYIAETTGRSTTFDDKSVLKKGKTVYFRVRSFKLFNGKTEYSPYATIKVKIS